MVSVWSCLAFFAFQMPQEPDPAQTVPEVIPSVTFSSQPREVWVPLRKVGESFGWQVEWNESDQKITISGRELSEKSLYVNPQHTAFIRLTSLPYLEVDVAEVKEDAWFLTHGEKTIAVQEAEQRVEINLSEQKLMAFQGPYLVMSTNVSTGRRGFSTPAGQYRAQSKARHRVSRTYDNAPMPYSVQLKGGYFIHGSGSVPRRPASHGCVRMPLTGENPARKFFEWVEVGTPIEIRTDWSDEASKAVVIDS